MSFTFNGTDFGAEHDVEVLDVYNPSTVTRGEAVVLTFPGTELRRAYRGIPKAGFQAFRVAFPHANLNDILDDLYSITMETLEYEDSSWEAIWDGDSLHIEVYGDYAFTTIRFLT